MLPKQLPQRLTFNLDELEEGLNIDIENAVRVLNFAIVKIDRLDLLAGRVFRGPASF